MKNARLDKILEIIKDNDVETQEELVRRLQACGFEVTQATVSRDIRELGLSKAQKNGRNVYVSPQNGQTDQTIRSARKFSRVLQEAFISAEAAGTLVVIRTMTGMAMAAAASLDNMKLPGVVGCLAGDDTIFVALRSPEDASELAAQLLSMLKA